MSYLMKVELSLETCLKVLQSSQVLASRSIVVVVLVYAVLFLFVTSCLIYRFCIYVYLLIYFFYFFPLLFVYFFIFFLLFDFNLLIYFVCLFVFFVFIIYYL